MIKPISTMQSHIPGGAQGGPKVEHTLTMQGDLAYIASTYVWVVGINWGLAGTAEAQAPLLLCIRQLTGVTVGSKGRDV